MKGREEQKPKRDRYGEDKQFRLEKSIRRVDGSAEVGLDCNYIFDAESLILDLFISKMVSHL